MDFALTSEQEMFRQMFVSFAGKEVAKLADQIDRNEELPRKLLEKTAAQGFWGAIAPEERGGAGLDTISYTFLLEALAAECMSTALTLHVHNSLALRTILRHGTTEAQAHLVPDMVEGKRLGAFALTEATAGSDPSHLRTRAERRGQRWVLNGSKSWVSNGGLAGVYVVFATSDPAADGHGLSAFVVPAETPGLEVGGREKTLGLRGASITRLYLNDCQLPASHLLGTAGQGYRIALEALDFGRIGVSAAAIGASRRALDIGTQYAIERRQFGVPIVQKQAIQAFLADAQTSLTAAECLVRHAAWLVDQDRPYTQAAAMAKLFASRVAADVTDNMVQIHGGAGFILDYPIQRYYRDARSLEILEGTSQIQQAVIAGGMLAPHGVKVRP